MIVVKCVGEVPGKSSMQVPGWGAQFHHWQDQTFADYAGLGFELVFDGDDVTVTPDSVPAPFSRVAGDTYQIQTPTTLLAKPGEKALVLPHYKFHTDPTWETPVATPAVVAADWWPFPLTVRFRFGPIGKSVFRRGEPFAQVVVLADVDQRVVPATPAEVARTAEAREFVNNNRGQYATRSWMTDDGVAQDNVYNVFARLEEVGGIPEEVRESNRPKRVIFRRSNVPVVQDQKANRKCQLAW